MNTVKIKNKSTLMIAHRGVSGLETENTVPAFVACGNRSYYGAECDIRKTKDGKFILCHDRSYARISGISTAVNDMTLDELHAVTLFDVDGSNHRADIRPTTLEEYVSVCKKYEKKCIIELKELFSDEDILAYIDVIKKYDHLESCIFIAFSYDNLKNLRKFLPSQPVQFLCSEISDEMFDRLVRDGIDLDIEYTSVTKELIDPQVS